MTPQIFDFKDQPVRVAGTPDLPLFVATDVCRVLEIANSRDALSRLDEDEKGVVTADTPGGQQQLAAVTESGLYALIFTSRKPEAKVFRRWVTGEVLPALRKTGSYSPKAPDIDSEVAGMISAVMAAFEDRRAGRIDNGTASVLANLAKQYCQLWDVRLRLQAPALAPAHP